MYGALCKIISHKQYNRIIAARTLTGTRKNEHVTPVLLNLHGLPVAH